MMCLKTLKNKKEAIFPNRKWEKMGKIKAGINEIEIFLKRRIN